VKRLARPSRPVPLLTCVLRIEDFHHEADELVTVLGDQKEFEVAGVVYHPQAGEGLPAPAGAVHSARDVGKATARRLCGHKQVQGATEQAWSRGVWLVPLRAYQARRRSAPA
jgi:hypothetical protein